MKKILLHGYTQNNLGDDLFFRVITDRYPDVKFYLPTLRTENKSVFSDISNLKIVDFLGISKLTSHKTYLLPKLYSKLYMKRFDAVVCIGGSLFIDQKNPPVYHRREVENYSFIQDWEIAAKAGKPYFVLGANWGPCFNDYFFENFNRAFDSITDIYFRDSFSADVFKAKKNIRHGGDILMGAEYVKNAVSCKSKKKQVAISVIDVSQKSEYQSSGDSYTNKIVDICREFTGLGYEVILMSFCRSEGDETQIDRIIGKLGGIENVRVLNYSENICEMLSAIAESELVIASRFHATVLGWTLGTPVFSLVYSNKTIHMLEDCGVSQGYIRIDDLSNVSAEQIISQAIFVDSKEFTGTDAAFAELDKLIKSI